jgi:hypothetical protein
MNILGRWPISRCSSGPFPWPSYESGPWTAGRANAPERRHTARTLCLAIYAALPVFNLCRGNCLSSSRTGRPNQCRLMSSALNLSRMIPKLSEQPERT